MTRLTTLLCVLCACACSSPAGELEGDAGGADAADAAPGPTPCTGDPDCEETGACPSDVTLGCACATTPSGQMCVPRCETQADCRDDQTCSADLVCVGGGGGGPDGGVDDKMTIEDTVSDQAQSMTIAFDGLAFVTGSFCAQTFYPPGKVADFFGFQYLRDNDPSGMGHNTAFTTLTADPVLALLSEAQVTMLIDLADQDHTLGEAYGYARFPLAKAFRRLYEGDTPTDHPALDLAAVRAYSAYLFAIDGEMTFLRAQAYADVLGAMSADQLAVLDAMKGTGSLTWPQPDAAVVDAILAAHPQYGQDLRTYAGEMLAWYIGSREADVYFCPERQGTYFGSFFMKDIKAMHIPSYTIDSNMTADFGDYFLAQLTSDQAALVTGLVEEQRAALTTLVTRRGEIADALRAALAGTAALDEATIVDLSRAYGELDGEISYEYATAFSAVGATLDATQMANLMAKRREVTTTETEDFDAACTGYIYSTSIPAPTVEDTDFLFGVCAATGAGCSRDWDCCSFSCAPAGSCL